MNNTAITKEAIAAACAERIASQLIYRRAAYRSWIIAEVTRALDEHAAVTASEPAQHTEHKPTPSLSRPLTRQQHAHT